MVVLSGVATGGGIMALTAYLKKSEFIVHQVRSLRGLVADARAAYWTAKRAGQIKAYLRTHEIGKLQLGVDYSRYDGWLCTDIEPHYDSVVYMDVTKPFPFEDGTFDYVMAEHMIEHIDFKAGQAMLRECYRVLKPGGKVRLSTPDLQLQLSVYGNGSDATRAKYVDWYVERNLPGVTECKEVFLLNCAVRGWGHTFLYDRETLAYALASCGFRDLKFYEAGQSEDPNLRGVEAHGKEVGNEEMNSFETIAVEARKP